MVDEILLQEIQSLKEKLKIAIEIIKYYEPDLDESKFYHDIGTEDYLLYIENNSLELKEENKRLKAEIDELKHDIDGGRIMECRYCKNKDICQYEFKCLEDNCPSYEYRGYGEKTAEELGLAPNEFGNYE